LGGSGPGGGRLANNRLGLRGHYYGGMLDIQSDLTLPSIAFGTHIEPVEVDELSARKREVSSSDLQERLRGLPATFEIQADCDPADLAQAARTSVALKPGPVTLLSVIESGDGKLALLCAEAESVAGLLLEMGNTNRRYRFACGAREFVNRGNRRGPAHHCAVGRGHLFGKIEKLGQLLRLETIRVT
jgi:L-arabinose isomerase